MSELLQGDDRALLPGARVDDAFSNFFGNAPQVAGGAATTAARRPSVAPRARNFAAHLDGREEGSEQTRRQAMREKHGWSIFRPRWWNQQSRDYQTAHKAEKLRYQGFSRLANRQAELNAAAGKEVAPEAGAADAATAGTGADRALVDKYSSMKGELKQAAGWKRFLPFSSTRKHYKAARQELRTGSVLDDNTVGAFAKFAPKMPSVQARMARQKELEAKDSDLNEVLGILGGSHAESEQKKPDVAKDVHGSGESSHFSYGGQLADKQQSSSLGSHGSGGQGGIDDVIAKHANEPNAKAFESMLAHILQNPEAQPNAHESGEQAPEDEDDPYSATNVQKFMMGDDDADLESN